MGAGAISISGNTVVNGGIFAGADGVSVTSNKIFRSGFGILLGTSVAAIQGNTIVNSTIAIDLGCIANPNVHSNIAMRYTISSSGDCSETYKALSVTQQFCSV
jgi:hypothetical protein